MCTTSSKPNCYDCQYRRDLPGDAHSKCIHPLAMSQGTNPVDPLIELLSIFGGGPPLKSDLNVIGNPHGISRGWFTWPFNFDPVWLVSCDGFEIASKKED